jgi:hypothetical protein
MMGRNRDAHNDSAGQFDADRHAAFWRGLIEADRRLEDAHAHLEQAGPVMGRYSTAGKRPQSSRCGSRAGLDG